MPLFSGTPEDAYTDIEFEQPDLQACYGKLYCFSETEALSSRAWRDIISFDDNDLCLYGFTNSYRTSHVEEVPKGMLVMACGQFVEDADVWI